MTMLNDDGDVIRGLGFVTLYAAYMEEAVDDCFRVLLAARAKPDERIWRQPTSAKLRYCRRRLDELAPITEELRQFADVLDYVGMLLERRHEYIHGRIYAQFNAPDQLSSGRRNVPDREIRSAELYELANAMWRIRSPLMSASMFALSRLIAARKK
jgi:hypothetical protein